MTKPKFTGPLRSHEIERLWGYGERQENGCLLWGGPQTASFSLKRDGKPVQISPARAAYIAVHGELSVDLVVAHRCDTTVHALNRRVCIEPEHLLAVTPAEAEEAKARRGRFWKNRAERRRAGGAR